MKVTCKCCNKRFDIPIREVLAMAAKLAENRMARPRRNLPDVNGNVLPANDVDAKRQREDAIVKRLSGL